MKTVSGLKQFRFFLFLLLLFIAPCIYAQEASDNENRGAVEADVAAESAEGVSEDTPEGEGLAEAESEAEPEPPKELTHEQKNIEMEIKTSTLAELAAWCRLLGLSEGGDVNSLRDRLRAHFELPAPIQAEEDDKRKIITIESARSTEYFKIDEVDEEYARLTGDVRVTLKDGDAVHEIKAWEILFNRTRNIITASGGVEYTKSESGKPTEIFRGDSITVDINNWSSVFLGGSSERSFQGGENDTAYLFSGTVISRNDEDTTVLSKATISSAKNKEALWSLTANRVWLLPGSDFAIFNALLRVGEFPVLYLPFFYYPADEVVFHPALGYRPREGNYVQTTTYLLGRPPPTEQTSLAKMLGNSTDMEKKWEGLFLRSTGKTPQTKSETMLKLMADYYANLGGYVGVDLVMPKLGILNSLDLSTAIAFTRTVANLDGGYTPFAPAYDGTSDWNNSNLFSMQVPFRYNFKMSSSIKGKYGSFSWNIPYYSDPFLDRDFSTRKEEMDWLNMLEQGATALDGDISSENFMSSPVWQVTGSVNLPRFSVLEPYVNSITVSGISSTISFGLREMNRGLSTNDPAYYSPSRYFFYPNNATLYSVNASITGIPLNLGTKSTSGSSAKTKDEIPNPFEGFGEARSPWKIGEEEDDTSSSSADELVPPVLKQTFNLPNVGNFQLKLDYSISPSASSALKFDSGEGNWPESKDIDWSDVESVISTFGAPVRATLNFGHTSGFYTGSLTFSGTGEWHQIDYINEDAEKYAANPTQVQNDRETQYRQSRFSTSFALSNTLKPLYKSDIFGQSNLRYDLSGLAIRSNFVGMNGDDPEWELQYGEWDKEKITTHRLDANLNANVMDKSQSLTLSATMPPKETVLSGTATFNAWIVSTRASMGVRSPMEDDKRKLDPFSATATFSFGTYGSFSQRMELDTEEKEFTSLTSTLSLPKWGLSSSFSAIRTAGYKLNTTDPAEPIGWITLVDNPTLQPRDFTLSYSKRFEQGSLWHNRIKYNLQLQPSLSFDLLRFTSSQFNFLLGYNMTINNFMEIGLTFRSENAVIYRYYRDLLPDLPSSVRNGEGEQFNVFSDLLNSFRFDDDDRRRSSGFKMKRFDLNITHFMGDWTAKLIVGMTPYVPTNSRQYQLNTEITFTIDWIPIDMIKTRMEYKKREDTWIIE